MMASDEVAHPRPDWGHNRRSSSPPAPPPYQLRKCTFLMVGAQFDRALAQSLLPPGLEASDEGSGGFYMYTADEGWAVAPLTATLAWLDVKGFDSADGSRGRYQTVSHYSGTIAELTVGWNRLSRTGYCELRTGEGNVRGVGGPTGEVHLSLEISPAPEVPQAVAGTHYYFMVSDGGVLQQVPVAYSYDFVPAQLVDFRCSAPPGTMLSRMVPKRLHWAGYLTGGSITIGEPRRVGDGNDASASAAHIVHLELLSRLGRGAMLLGSEGSVLFCNDTAREMAEGLFEITGGRLNLWDREAQKYVLHALSQNAGPLEPIALARRTGGHPLLLQLVTARQETRSRLLNPSMLLILTDPARGVERDPTRALQLLGLTPAESRLAAAVGGGVSPKEAARALNNTEATVRTTLAQIYSKLQIRRQSELARIVARIENLGL